jgi:hypothetical protein
MTGRMVDYDIIVVSLIEMYINMCKIVLQRWFDLVESKSMCL